MNKTFVVTTYRPATDDSRLPVRSDHIPQPRRGGRVGLGPAGPVTPAQLIGALEGVKRAVAPLCGALPSATMRDRARRIYNLARELQNDLARAPATQDPAA